MDQKAETLWSCIFDALTNEVPLSNLLSGLEDAFGLCVRFCDIFGRIVLGKENDKLIRYMNQTAQEEFRQKLYRQVHLTIPAGQIDERPYLIRVVSGKGGTNDRLVVLEIGELDAAFYLTAADLLAHVYQHYWAVNILDNGSLMRDSLAQILSRELLFSGDDMAEKLLESNPNTFRAFCPSFCILSICGRTSSLPERKLHSAIQQIAPHTFSVATNDSFLVFLYNLSRPIRHGDLIYEQLLQFCVQYDLSICYSRLFQDLTLRQAYVKQVRKTQSLALRMGIDKNMLSADTLLRNYLCYRVGKNLDPELIRLTAVEYLAQWDREHDSQYLPTLTAYLRSSNNASIAAQSLFIDRTTLKYRLKRIQDIIRVDVDDPQNALSLRAGLIVYETFV